jgi:hypothetical protein
MRSEFNSWKKPCFEFFLRLLFFSHNTTQKQQPLFDVEMTVDDDLVSYTVCMKFNNTKSFDSSFFYQQATTAAAQ